MGLPIAAVALTAAGAAVAGASTYMAARGQRKISEANARIARQQAIEAGRIGEVEEAAHRARVSRLVGLQRALVGASGVTVGEGTTADLEADTYMLGELDALTIRNNAYRQAWGYRALAMDYGFRARMARTQGILGTAATTLGGGAQTISVGSQLKVW